MEQVLDDIADGKIEATPYLKSFYDGENGLSASIDAGLDTIDAREVSGITFEKWMPYVVRVGKYGPYVEFGEDDERKVASIPPDAAPGDIEQADLARFIEEKERGDDILGIHPAHEMPVFVKKGPYGSYVQLGDDEQEGKPKRVSVPKNMDAADVDFDKALKLLELPKELGNHPDTGKVIKANIGRFGPYVQHGSVFASLTKDDDILGIGYDRALELIAKKEARNKPLRVIGEHPESGDMIEVWEGRYGPYVKHQRVNASLPKNQPVEAVTLQDAIELLNAKATKKKGTSRSKKKK
jgi:DNA topoisomerase-1